jgi:hypothetical protein
MFDKYRARFAKFEEDHESVRKVKKHLQDNKQTYLIGAVASVRDICFDPIPHLTLFRHSLIAPTTSERSSTDRRMSMWLSSISTHATTTPNRCVASRLCRSSQVKKRQLRRSRWLRVFCHSISTENSRTPRDSTSSESRFARKSRCISETPVIVQNSVLLRHYDAKVSSTGTSALCKTQSY